MQFNPRLFHGLSEKDKEEFINVLKYSPVIKRLIEVIESQKNELVITRGDYDNPSWAFKQAHYNGELHMAQKILSLLRPTEK